MKKLLYVLLASTVISFVGCGGGNKIEMPKEEAQPPAEQPKTESPGNVTVD